MLIEDTHNMLNIVANLQGVLVEWLDITPTLKSFGSSCKQLNTFLKSESVLQILKKKNKSIKVDISGMSYDQLIKAWSNCRIPEFTYGMFELDTAFLDVGPICRGSILCVKHEEGEWNKTGLCDVVQICHDICDFDTYENGNDIYILTKSSVICMDTQTLSINLIMSDSNKQMKKMSKTGNILYILREDGTLTKYNGTDDEYEKTIMFENISDFVVSEDDSLQVVTFQGCLIVGEEKTPVVKSIYSCCDDGGLYYLMENGGVMLSLPESKEFVKQDIENVVEISCPSNSFDLFLTKDGHLYKSGYNESDYRKMIFTEVAKNVMSFSYNGEKLNIIHLNGETTYHTSPEW